jgi:hypothetical protein
LKQHRKKYSMKMEKYEMVKDLGPGRGFRCGKTDEA